MNLKASPEDLVESLDYALREEGRKQQTKTGFFDSFLGKFVVIIVKVGLNYLQVPYANQIVDGVVQTTN